MRRRTAFVGVFFVGMSASNERPVGGLLHFTQPAEPVYSVATWVRSVCGCSPAYAPIS